MDKIDDQIQSNQYSDSQYNRFDEADEGPVQNQSFISDDMGTVQMQQSVIVHHDPFANTQQPDFSDT